MITIPSFSKLRNTKDRIYSEQTAVNKATTFGEVLCSFGRFFEGFENVVYHECVIIKDHNAMESRSKQNEGVCLLIIVFLVYLYIFHPFCKFM